MEIRRKNQNTSKLKGHFINHSLLKNQAKMKMKIKGLIYWPSMQKNPDNLILLSLDKGSINQVLFNQYRKSLFFIKSRSIWE